MTHSLTSKLGTLSYTDTDVIHFPQGLLGFEDYQNHLIVQKESQSPFFYLQSIDHHDLCFGLIDPKRFFPDYTLETETPYEHTHHFAIVTQREEDTPPTANLLGPILIDKKQQQGWQVISKNLQYSTRHPIHLESIHPPMEVEAEHKR